MVMNDRPDRPAGDACRAQVLERANAPVRIRNEDGRFEMVTEFEVRLLELASGDCRRRLYCMDFIQMVLATLMSSSPATSRDR